MTNYLAEIAAHVRSEVEGGDPPSDSDDLFLLYALLVRAKGEDVTASDVHDAWSAWMVTRDATHRSLLPFAELPAAVQQQDEPYVAAIHRVAIRLRTQQF